MFDGSSQCTIDLPAEHAAECLGYRLVVPFLALKTKQVKQSDVTLSCDPFVGKTVYQGCH